MPDWKKLVSERLSSLALETADKNDVCAELAGHLEDSYESLRTKGLPEQAAIDQTLKQVSDWHDFQRRIHSARMGKDSMTNRVKQLWLPGLLTFVLSSGILALFQILGPRPWIQARIGNLPVPVIFIPWFLSLPLVGAMGAYLSWRAGGTQRAVLLSILFPVLPFLASLVVLLPVSLFFDRFIAHSTVPFGFVLTLFAWVLIPGAALLVGGWPTQLYFSRRLTSRRVANN